MYRETLNFILMPTHIYSYVWLFCCGLLITLSGITIFNYILKTKNKIIQVAGGMILGPLTLLFILSIISYILKGKQAIILLFFFYCLLAIPTIITIKNTLKRFKSAPKITKKNISTATIILFLIVHSIFLFFITNTTVTGGDRATYWSIATSFTRGNYPTVSPWQPDLLTVYHEGTFLVMGTLHAVSGMSIAIVHFFFSWYCLVALSLLLVGMSREYTRSLWSLFPSLITSTNFGGPLLLISGFTEFINTITSYANLTQTMSKIAKFPQFFQSRGIGGNCGAWIGDLIFCNFRAFGLMTFVLFVYLLIHLNKKSNRYANSILVVIMLLTLSIDETLFPIEACLFSAVFLYNHFKEKNIKLFLIESSWLFGLSICLFFLIQNPVRDSLLNPKPPQPRFSIMSNTNIEFALRATYIKSQQIKFQGTTWYLPDLRILILLLGAISLKSKYKTPILLTISAAISVLLAFIFIDNYYPSNGYRFIYTSYILLIIAAGLVLLQAITSQKKHLRNGAILIIVLFFFPQFMTATAFATNQIKENSIVNFIQDYAYKDQGLDWIAAHIPYDKRVIIIDKYPRESIYSELTQNALINYGIFVPVSPSKPKVMNLDDGSEWFDSITTLNPAVIKQQKIQYLYVTPQGYARLTEERKKQLQNKELFKIDYASSFGKIYQIKQAFLQISSEEVTIKKIIDAVEKNSTVFIHEFPFVQIRKGLILALDQKVKTFGPQFHSGRDFFMHIEYKPRMVISNSLEEANKVQSIQYVVGPPSSEEQIPHQYKKIMESEYITLWKK